MRAPRLDRRAQVALFALLVLAAAAGLVMLLRTAPERAGGPIDFAEQGVGLRSITVYYLAADSLALVPEERQMLVRTSRRAMAEELVILLATPSEGRRSPLPPGTRLLHYFEEGGTLILDFNDAVLFGGGDAVLEDRLTLRAVVRSLGENLKPTGGFRLLVNGRPLRRWGRHLEIDPVLRPEDWP